MMLMKGTTEAQTISPPALILLVNFGAFYSFRFDSDKDEIFQKCQVGEVRYCFVPVGVKMRLKLPDTVHHYSTITPFYHIWSREHA